MGVALVLWLAAFGATMALAAPHAALDTPWRWLLALVLHAPYGAILIFLTLGLVERVGYFAQARRPPAPGVLPADLPDVCVQLPMFNEHAVARRIIETAAALDWPRDKLLIQVLDDSTDPAVRAMVDRACAAVRREHGVRCAIVRRTDRAGYKAGALEEGRRKTDAQFLAIFDADFLPPPDFLHRVLAHFFDASGAPRDRLALVQAQWGHLNDEQSALTAAQALWVDDHHTLQQSWRSAVVGFVNFTGTAGVWRASAIEAVGGWRSASLVEDCELSVRALFAGYRTRFVRNVVAPAELPQTFDAYRLQQKRWTQGWAQLQRLHVSTLLRRFQTPWPRKIYLLYFMCISWQWPLWLAWMTVFPFLIAHGLWLGKLGTLEGALAYLAPPLAFAVFAAVAAATQTHETYRDRAGSPLIGGLRRFARLGAYLVVNAGMLPHHVCAFVEGMCGPMHSEFERTPKTAAMGASATPPALIKPTGRGRRRAYLAFETGIVATQLVWIGFFLLNDLVAPAIWAAWLVACIGGVRVAPRLRRALAKRRPVRAVAGTQPLRLAIIIAGTIAVLALTVSASADDDAEAAAGRARAAAGEDRHDEAIEAFRAAIAAAPERREEWLVELADQLTWAGRLDEALALYQEASWSADGRRAYWAQVGLARALAWQDRHGESLAVYDRLLARHPDDREIRLARAEVLAWAGRQDAALDAYRAILDDDPDDMEAQRGAARVLSWEGRHRRAVDALSPLLQERPGDRQATIIAAESLVWMGRGDRAASLLRGQLERDPGDVAAGALLQRIEADARPWARVDVRRFDQSDDLEIDEIAAEVAKPFIDGRGYAGVRYVGARYRPPRGPVDEITVNRIGFIGGYRISDWLGWNGAIFADSIDTRGAPGDHDILTYDTYVSVIPNDLLRFDVGAARRTFDSEPTLRTGLEATSLSASADIIPDGASRYSVRVRSADYSDGNEEVWWQAEAQRRILKEPFILAGVRYTGFDFSLPDQNGYYSPDRYDAIDVPARVSWRLSERVQWDVAATLGYEEERGGDTRVTTGGGVALGWQVTDGAELQLAYDYSSSSTFATTGFSRGVARVSLLMRF